MYNCILQVIDTLCNLKDQLIIWPNPNDKKMESMKNSNWKRFFSAIEKLDNIDIVLKFKPGVIFKREIFFNQKKWYTLDLYAICDFLKRFTNILASWPNL